jgi:hypothetical protein
MAKVELTIDGIKYVCTPATDTERRVIAYSQRDPRWAKVHLGPSSLTMGGSGCAVTAVTMLGTLVQDITPLGMVEYLNSHGGFTSGGLLYWSVAAQAVDGLSFVNYTKWRTYPADIEAVKRALSHNPQVVQVDFRPATSVLDTHFVTALSMTADGSDINIIDPWTGERGTLLGMYSKEGWDLERAVYALAEYRVE